MLRHRIILAIALLGFADARAVAQVSDDSGYALTKGPAQEILTFGPATATGRFSVTSADFITGLQPNEQLLRMDLGPSGALYAVSSQNRLYTLRPGGVASLVQPFTPKLNGTVVGFAVNSAANQATIVTNLGQNFQLDLVGHLVSAGGSLTYAPNQHDSAGEIVTGTPRIEDIAFPPGPNAQLYGLDENSQSLVRIVGAGDPSGCLIYTVAAPLLNGESSVRVPPTAVLSFLPDGTPVDTIPFIGGDGTGVTASYQLSLADGNVSQIFSGFDDSNGASVGMVSVVFTPEPSVAGLILVAAGAVFRRRRR